MKTAWDAVSVDNIKKSFRVSRIVLNPDGSEDDNIHSIQADRVEAQMREELSWKTALLTQEEDDNDLFLDREDDEEQETNETVIDDDTD